MTRLPLLLSLLAASTLVAAIRADVTIRSGPEAVALIEVYTSEDCSSCPPAEKWLGERNRDPGLWKTFVPVAFHVNYWDHLGWRDALANKAFTDREHAYAAAWNSQSVYTPCFVCNGLEWRPSERVGTASGNAAGLLIIKWSAETNRCEVKYSPAGKGAAAPNLEVSVALLGSGIVSNVRKGENAGRELRHEFVALRLERSAMKRDALGAWSASVVLPPRSDIAAGRRALATWVTPRGQLTPIQAAGGWIE